MSCQIVEILFPGDLVPSGAAFMCDTSDWFFGPLMPDADTAEDFEKFLGCDPRSLTNTDLENRWGEFVRQQREAA